MCYPAIRRTHVQPANPLCTINRAEDLSSAHYKGGFLKDLGWANHWGGYNSEKTPTEVKECRAAGHKRTDTDIGRPPNRGLNHLVTCEQCGIQWHYDSSD